MPALPAAPVVITWLFLATVAATVLVLAAGARNAARVAGRPAPRATRRALLATALSLAWLVAMAAVARSGVLLRTDLFPPAPMRLLGPILLLVIVIAASPVGRRLARGSSVAALIGVHALRIPVEIVLHRLAEAGVAPPQMTWSGRNLDVLTGLTALAILLVQRGREVPPWLAWSWNALGFFLLSNVVTVALLSMPTPFRVFWNELANVFVPQAPFVWLPTFLVPCALLGHLVLGRRLLGH